MLWPRTGEGDYLIDALALHDHLDLLREPLASTDILKASKCTFSELGGVAKGTYINFSAVLIPARKCCFENWHTIESLSLMDLRSCMGEKMILCGCNAIFICT